MPTFYRGPSAYVDEDVFIAIGVMRYTYQLRELQDVFIAVCPTVRVVVRRHSYELRATYRGREVCLFQSTDLRVFGQVSRALLRALEYRSDTR